MQRDYPKFRKKLRNKQRKTPPEFRRGFQSRLIPSKHPVGTAAIRIACRSIAIIPACLITIGVSDNGCGIVIERSGPPFKSIVISGPIPIVRRSRKNISPARACPFVPAAEAFVFVETRVIGDIPRRRSPLGRIDAILTRAGHSRRASGAGDSAVDFEF